MTSTGPQIINIPDIVAGTIRNQDPNTPPEEHMAPTLSGADLPDNIGKHFKTFGLFFNLKRFNDVKETHVSELVENIKKTLLPDLIALRVRKENPNKMLMKDPSYSQLLALVKHLNTFERLLAASNHENKQELIGCILECFEDMLEALENTRLKHTCVYELILGFTAQMNFAMSDACTKVVYGEVQALLDQDRDILLGLKPSTKEKLRQAINYIECGSQYYEILMAAEQSHYAKGRARIANSIASTKASLYAKIGHADIARKYLYQSLNDIESRPFIMSVELEAITGYLLLMRCLSNRVLFDRSGQLMTTATNSQEEFEKLCEYQQQMLYWAEKLSKVLTSKPLANSSTSSITQAHVEGTKYFVDHITSQAIYANTIQIELQGRSPNKWELRHGSLIVPIQTMPRCMSQLNKHARKLNMPYQLEENKLIVPNVLDIRYKQFKILAENIVEFSAKARDLIAAQKAKEQAQREKSISTSSSTAQASSEPNAEQKPDFNESDIDILAANVTKRFHALSMSAAVEKEQASAISQTSPSDANSPPTTPKVKIKTRPQQPAASKESQDSHKGVKKEYTAQSLGLGKEYAGVVFKKLDGAMNTIVGFRPTFGGKQLPEQVIIDRFRATLCEYPQRVGPKNENGFKWLTPSSHQAPILMGKIKSLPWRLLPAEELTVGSKKKVIIYGDFSNTKSGKKANRYNSR